MSIFYVGQTDYINQLNLLYGPANILGTVSQTAGVPTGAIFQDITNANGKAVMYADGTMICYGSIVASSIPITTANGGSYISAVQSLTYAANFISVPSVDMYVQLSTSGLVGLMQSSASNSSVGGYLFSAVSRTDTVTLSYQAIGRWF